MHSSPSDIIQTSHFLKTRRSIRRFKNQPVPDETVRALIEIAAHAPSAHNLQPWRFVHIKSPAARAALSAALLEKLRADMQSAQASPQDIDQRAARSRRRIDAAPAILLVCRDTAAVRAAAREEAVMGIQSVANATLTLLLAAHGHGLAGNWVCWPLYAPVEVRAALALPANWQPEAMLFIGYPAETPPPKALLPLKEIFLQK